MRAKAIVCCLWFGLLPWWVYERECHYKGTSWVRHLWFNLRYAWVWATFRQTPLDREFEATVNAHPNWVRGFGHRRITAEQERAR